MGRTVRDRRSERQRQEDLTTLRYGKARSRTFLETIPEPDRRLVEAVLRSQGGKKYQYTAEHVHKAILLHREKKIPLSIAFELILGIGKFPEGNRIAQGFLTNLRERFEVSNKHGKVIVTPSFFNKTGRQVKIGPKDLTHPGLNQFTWMSFRIAPPGAEIQRFKKYLPLLEKGNQYNHGLIVEIGLTHVGKKPVVVVTNAQAIKHYYSLPWKLKRVFKGSYEKTLEIISQASGGLPLLIPSNKTVTEYIRGVFPQHKIPKGVLNEFYDRFCEKRGRRKATLKLKNALGEENVEAEFWGP